MIVPEEGIYDCPQCGRRIKACERYGKFWLAMHKDAPYDGVNKSNYRKKDNPNRFETRDSNEKRSKTELKSKSLKHKGEK